ncbi:MAG: hypothetical protein JXR22_08655 [Prolixibacteraceae bacterium]|nr:hypothetical protein [Prolixibacteraceae bacterium]
MINHREKSAQNNQLANLLLLIFLFVPFVACTEDQPNETVADNDSFSFVKVGNKWEYNYITDDYTTVYSYQILSDAGQHYYQVKFCLGLLCDSEPFWYADDHQFSIELGTFPPNHVFPLFKTGAAVGDEMATFFDSDEGDVTNILVAKDETVTVPAGTFAECYKIQQTLSTDDNILTYYWLNLKSGIVKMHLTGYAEDDVEREYFPITLELKSKNF